jgi:hypothetical protein
MKQQPEGGCLHNEQQPEKEDVSIMEQQPEKEDGCKTS